MSKFILPLILSVSALLTACDKKAEQPTTQAPTQEPTKQEPAKTEQPKASTTVSKSTQETTAPPTPIHQTAIPNTTDEEKLNNAIMQVMQKDNPQIQKQGYDTLLDLANKGNLDAMHQIGQLYISPSPIESIIQTNPKEAEKWLVKAGEQNHSMSQTFLGFAYRGSHGFPNDMEKSCYWHKKAYEQNNDNLGLKIALEICPK